VETKYKGGGDTDCEGHKQIAGADAADDTGAAEETDEARTAGESGTADKVGTEQH
jgi:hypothetical protein